MKKLLAVCLLLISLASAKDRNWQDAIFLGITTSSEGAAAMPIGTMVMAIPLTGRTYWLKSGGLIYAVANSYTKWPNLTVNGHTKIAVEGRKLHILDEDGKDRKFTIIEKIAPKE